MFRYTDLKSPYFKGALWLLLAASVSYALLLSVKPISVASKETTDCVVNESGRDKEEMFFPYRVCLDGDIVRHGCIYGVAVHLDNIGMECSVDSLVSMGNGYEARVSNPTEYERWLVVNVPCNDDCIIRFKESILPIHRVNGGFTGVLIPPFSSGPLFCRQGEPILPQLWIASFVALLSLILLVISSRVKRAS